MHRGPLLLGMCIFQLICFNWFVGDISVYFGIHLNLFNAAVTYYYLLHSLKCSLTQAVGHRDRDRFVQ